MVNTSKRECDGQVRKSVHDMCDQQIRNCQPLRVTEFTTGFCWGCSPPSSAVIEKKKHFSVTRGCAGQLCGFRSTHIFHLTYANEGCCSFQIIYVVLSVLDIKRVEPTNKINDVLPCEITKTATSIKETSNPQLEIQTQPGDDIELIEA